MDSPAPHYENKLRVRVCGLMIEEGKLLLVELKSPLTNSWIWMPPGGGVEFGETLEEALTREFLEETGISISVGERIHINEIVEPPIHAIEFYFLVSRVGGELNLGKDPEENESGQILRDIRFFTQREIRNIPVMPELLKRGKSFLSKLTNY